MIQAPVNFSHATRLIWATACGLFATGLVAAAKATGVIGAIIAAVR